MAKMLYKTRGNSDPSRKPRVYFTCHPDDFALHFDKLCGDVLRYHDCVIYYTEDMREEITDEEKITDLGQMNLFIVPVTFRLLSQPSRAMDADIAYAKENNIPILPFMMEQGIEELYIRPEAFGERQYLSPYSTDPTEINYRDKLKNHLAGMFTDNETAKRVRAEFDAYIFLSYRKKDRRYANELMRAIHKIREYRDVAIWYDEFLTPGESFQENIHKALANSTLFMLLVTPNLLEKSNFVMREEYPMAKKAGMAILPAEMEATDRQLLADKFHEIPNCVDPHDEEIFRERLTCSISLVTKKDNDSDPEHNYLIGLAYLYGIDVEVDRERAFTMITSAAEAGLPEAMRELFILYSSNAKRDYRQAVHWGEKAVARRRQTEGERSPEVLALLELLSDAYRALCDYPKALEAMLQAYEGYRTELGEEEALTLTVLSKLGRLYADAGERKKALETRERVYALRCKTLGERHGDTIDALRELATAHGTVGDARAELVLRKKAYELSRDTAGEEAHVTIATLSELAEVLGKLGERRTELDLQKRAYDLRCRVLGEEHPWMVVSMNALAKAYNAMGHLHKAIELLERAYTLSCRIFGEEDEVTLKILDNLAWPHQTAKGGTEGMRMLTRVYQIRARKLGEEHVDTVESQCNVARMLTKMAMHKEALGAWQKAYAMKCKALGENHPSTLITQTKLAAAYAACKDHKTALALEWSAYERCRAALGADAPDTLTVRQSVATRLFNVEEDRKKAIDLMTNCYEVWCRIAGKESHGALGALSALAVMHGVDGNRPKALELHLSICEIRRRAYGDAHPETINALIALANFYHQSNELQKAIETLELRLSICREHLGKESSDTFSAQLDIATAYRVSGDIRKAAELREELYLAMRKVYGTDNRVMLQLLMLVAMTYNSLPDQSPKQLSLLEESYAIHCRMYGEDSPATRKVAEAIKQLKSKL